MESGTVGKNGFLRLGFARRGRKTAMVDVERRVPFLVQRALYWDQGLPDMACVYLITTSGGILQGDRYSLEIDVGEDARAHLTTQGATKIQSMDTNYAAQAQTIRLHANAYLELLPEPVIPFRRSRFITDTRVERDPSATLLYSEILVPGRRYHHPDECFGFDVFSSRIRAFDPAGRETFCEKYLIEPQKRSIRQVGVMGSFDIYANVLLLTPRAQADAVQAQVGVGFSVEEALAFGASRLPNDAGLVFKVLGNELKAVKEKIREFWTTARSVVTGAVVPPPFLWR
jgi:urease accessory protein